MRVSIHVQSLLGACILLHGSLVAASCNADNSACSCKPTYSSTLTTTTSTTTSTPACTPTPSNNIVKNGGFECGLASWVAVDTYNNKHYVRGPGDNSANAYEFNQVGDTQFTQPGYVAASLSQNLTVTVGKSYLLKFRTYFDKCTIGEGFVGVLLNGGDDAGYTVDACDRYPANIGQFGDNTVGPFTASTNPENLRFEFLIDEPDAVVKLDNIMVVPA
ncbi:MAG: hypothetical protein Q9167_002807 [Letrouitia subvulpina]